MQSLLSYIRQVVFGFLSKFDYLKRQNATVIDYDTDNGKTTVSLLDGTQLSLYNKTGEMLSVGDNVLIYYWTKISSGYIGLRLGKTNNYNSNAKKYIIREQPSTITKYEYNVESYTEEGATEYTDFIGYAVTGSAGSYTPYKGEGVEDNIVGKTIIKNGVEYRFEVVETESVMHRHDPDSDPVSCTLCTLGWVIGGTTVKTSYKYYICDPIYELLGMGLHYTNVEYDYDTDKTTISMNDHLVSHGSYGLITMVLLNKDSGVKYYLPAPTVDGISPHKDIIEGRDSFTCYFKEEPKTDTRYKLTMTKTTEEL